MTWPVRHTDVGNRSLNYSHKLALLGICILQTGVSRAF